MANPTPLPVINLEAIKHPNRGESARIEEDIRKRDAEATRANFENQQAYNSRLRDVVFDTTVTDSLGSGLSGLQGRVKDTYTFPLGIPAVIEGDTLPLTPLAAVADSTIQEVHIATQVAPEGDVTIELLVGGALRATMVVPTGVSSLTHTVFTSATVTKNQPIGLRVVTAPDVPGQGWVVQVRCV